MRTLYAGPLVRRKLPKEIRAAFDSYYRQRKEKGVSYTLREFIPWWLENLKSFTGKTPTCGRIDHRRAYSWENIIMQDRRENSREAAIRNNLSGKGAKKKRILVYGRDGLVAEIPSIREAARLFGVSQRSIQFAIRGTFKNPKFTKNLVLKEVA